MVDPFLKLKYGNIVELDVHGKTLEEVRADLLYFLMSVDAGVSGVLVVHGFHQGTAIKSYLRNKFEDPRVIKKIHTDAGSTLLLLTENIANYK